MRTDMTTGLKVGLGLAGAVGIVAAISFNEDVPCDFVCIGPDSRG